MLRVKKKYQRKIKRLLRSTGALLTFGLFIFLAEGFSRNVFLKKEQRSIGFYQNRNIASINTDKQTFEFDCSSTTQEQKMTTSSATLRILFKNCKKDLSLKNVSHDHSLLTFPATNKLISSEFAYLRSGNNKFEIKIGQQTKTLAVYREN